LEGMAPFCGNPGYPWAKESGGSAVASQRSRRSRAGLRFL